MKIINQIKQMPQQMWPLIKEYPVELGLFLYAYIADLLHLYSFYYNLLIPLLLTLTLAYVLNNRFRSGYPRFIYYISAGVIWILSGLTDWSLWIRTTSAYLTLMVLCPLAILLCRDALDNRKIINNTLTYLYSLTSSLLLSSIAYGLFAGIFESIVYIFNVMTDDLLQREVYSNAARIIYWLLAPLLFFATLTRSFKTSYTGSRLVDILLNYIVTPALLIYTVILYIYFFKILLLWELPKGGIAYMVFAFTITALVVKALQLFVLNRRYTIFFKYLSYITLPALVMFWIGALRRISEYGLTENRIYLIICGIIMTVAILLFMVKRVSRYGYIGAFAFVLFASVIYIPPFSAKTRSVDWHARQAHRIAAQHNLLDNNGFFVREKRPVSDTVYVSDYKKLYTSLLYLADKDKEKLEKMNLVSPYEIFDFLPDEVESALTNTTEDRRKRNYYIETYDGLVIDSIAGYKQLIVPKNENYSSDSSQEAASYFQYRDGQLTIQRGSDTLLMLNGMEYMDLQLQEVGYSMKNFPEGDSFKLISDKLLVYRTDSLLVKFSFIRITEGQKGLYVDEMGVDFILIKE